MINDKNFEKRQRFSIRKFKFGAASALIGAFFVVGGATVSAQEVSESTTAPSPVQPSAQVQQETSLNNEIIPVPDLEAPTNQSDSTAPSSPIETVSDTSDSVMNIDDDSIQPEIMSSEQPEEVEKSTESNTINSNQSVENTTQLDATPVARDMFRSAVEPGGVDTANLNITSTPLTSIEAQYIGVDQTHSVSIAYSANAAPIENAQLKLQFDQTYFDNIKMAPALDGTVPVITSDGEPGKTIVTLNLGTVAPGTNIEVPFIFSFKDYDDAASGGNIDKASPITASLLSNNVQLTSADLQASAKARPVNGQVGVTTLSINPSRTMQIGGLPVVETWNIENDVKVNNERISLSVVTRHLTNPDLTETEQKYAIPNLNETIARIQLPEHFSLAPTDVNWKLVDEANRIYESIQPLKADSIRTMDLVNDFNTTDLPRVTFTAQTYDAGTDNVTAASETQTLTRQLEYRSEYPSEGNVLVSTTNYAYVGDRRSSIATDTPEEANAKGNIYLTAETTGPDDVIGVKSVIISRQKQTDSAKENYLNTNLAFSASSTNKVNVGGKTYTYEVFGVDAAGNETLIPGSTLADGSPYVAFRYQFNEPVLMKNKEQIWLPFNSYVDAGTTKEALVDGYHRFTTSVNFVSQEENKQVIDFRSPVVTWTVLEHTGVYDKLSADKSQILISETVEVRHATDAAETTSSNPFKLGIDYGDVRHSTTVPKGVTATLLSNHTLLDKIVNEDGSTTYIYDVRDDVNAQYDISRIREQLSFNLEVFDGVPIDQVKQTITIRSEVLYNKTDNNTSTNDVYTSETNIELYITKGLQVLTTVNDGGVYDQHVGGLLPGEVYEARSTFANITDTDATDVVTFVNIPKIGDVLGDGTASRGSEANSSLTGPVANIDPRFEAFYSIDTPAIGTAANEMTYVSANDITDWTQVTSIKFQLKDNESVASGEFVHFLLNLQIADDAKPGDNLVISTSRQSPGTNVVLRANAAEAEVAQPKQVIVINETTTAKDTTSTAPDTYNFTVVVTHADGTVKEYPASEFTDTNKHTVEIPLTSFEAVQSIELKDPRYTKLPNKDVTVIPTGDLVPFDRENIEQTYEFTLNTVLEESAGVRFEAYWQQNNGEYVRFPEKVYTQIADYLEAYHHFSNELEGTEYIIDSNLVYFSKEFIQSRIDAGLDPEQMKLYVESGLVTFDSATLEPIRYTMDTETFDIIRVSDNQVVTLNDLDYKNPSTSGYFTIQYEFTVKGFMDSLTLEERALVEQLDGFYDNLADLIDDGANVLLPLYTKGFLPTSDPVAGTLLANKERVIQVLVDLTPSKNLDVEVYDLDGNQLTVDHIEPERIPLNGEKINFDGTAYTSEIINNKERGSGEQQIITGREDFVAADGKVYEFVTSYSEVAANEDAESPELLELITPAFESYYNQKIKEVGEQFGATEYVNNGAKGYSVQQYYLNSEGNLREVVFMREKSPQPVIGRYVDEAGNQLQDEKTLVNVTENNQQGDEFTVPTKPTPTTITVDGKEYAYDHTEGKTTGTLTSNTQYVDYVFKLVMPQPVIGRFVDENGIPLQSDKTLIEVTEKSNQGDAFEVPAKPTPTTMTIDGKDYIYTRTDGKTVGTLTTNTQYVHYVFKEAAPQPVIGRFVDKDGNALQPSKTLVPINEESRQGDEFEVPSTPTPSTITVGDKQFIWIRTNGNTSGTLTTSEQVVDYVFEEAPQPVIGRFVDKDGNALQPSKTLVPINEESRQGDEFEVPSTPTPSTITVGDKQFIWIRTNGNTSGTLTTSEQVVDYVFEEAPQPVIGRFVDKDGNELQPNETLIPINEESRQGDEFEVPNKPTQTIITIDGKHYVWVRTNDNTTGKLTNNTQVVEYEFEELPQPVIGRYIDENGHPLLDEETLVVVTNDSRQGDEFNVPTQPKERIVVVDGKVYVFVRVDGNTFGTLTTDTQYVDYVFKEYVPQMPLDIPDETSEEDQPTTPDQPSVPEQSDNTSEQPSTPEQSESTPEQSSSSSTDKTATSESVVKQGMLPQTGEQDFALFIPAALAVLVGLGLMAAPRKKEEQEI